MKILHTADWHLGAKTDGKNRIDEQKKVMAEIVDVAIKNKVRIVIISGDIFDQAIPTSEAENLFFETLEALTKDNSRVVLVIAGNHDDPRRLSAGGPFAKKHNCIIAGDLKPIVEEKDFDGGRLSSPAPGSVLVEVKTNKGKEKCVVAMLPYPQEYRFGETSKDVPYPEKVQEWARIVTKGFQKDSVNILATHIMLVGSTANINGEEKELRVGDINALSKSDLPTADYYALGHIHSFQNLKGNYCYSGSPCFYDFKQKTAGVVLIDTNAKHGIKDIEYYQLKTPAKMVEVEYGGMAEASEKLKVFEDSDIVNLTIVQDEPLSRNDIKSIKQNFPCVTRVMLRPKTPNLDPVNYINNRKSLSEEKLFIEFYKQKKCVEPTREVVALFKELMEDKARWNL